MVLLPAAVAFWLLQLHLVNRDVKRAQLTAEALLLAHVVEGRLPHRAPVDFVQADGVDLEGIFGTITLRDVIEVIAFGPQGEQRTLTPGHSLEAQSAFKFLGAWPVWLGPWSPVVLDYLAEFHRQISLQTTTSVNQTEGMESVIVAVIDAPALPRAPQNQSFGEQIWVAIPILHRQEMVGGLTLGYPVQARDPLAGRMILELALRLLFVAAALAIILSVVSARMMFGLINRMAESLERFSNQLRRVVRAKDIPEPSLPQRRDSIGRLSAALHNTIGGLFLRIREAEAAVAEMAGEITNPMTSMKSTIKALRLQQDPSDSAKLLDVIDNDLLRLGRVEASLTQTVAPGPSAIKQMPEPKIGKKERFELISLITGRVAALRPAAATRGLGLTQLTPKVPVIIEGLPAAVGDILSAFLSNAIQRCAWGDEIRIWTRIQDRMVVVVVEDTGPPFAGRCEPIPMWGWRSGRIARAGGGGLHDRSCGSCADRCGPFRCHSRRAGSARGRGPGFWRALFVRSAGVTSWVMMLGEITAMTMMRCWCMAQPYRSMVAGC